MICGCQFGRFEALIKLRLNESMLKKATCLAALLFMAACSSGSVSDDSSKDNEKLSADRSEVEAYEQNDTTLSGEQNGKDFVNKVDGKEGSC